MLTLQYLYSLAIVIYDPVTHIDLKVVNMLMLDRTTALIQQIIYYTYSTRMAKMRLFNRIYGVLLSYKNQ